MALHETEGEDVVQTTFVSDGHTWTQLMSFRWVRSSCSVYGWKVCRAEGVGLKEVGRQKMGVNPKWLHTHALRSRCQRHTYLNYSEVPTRQYRTLMYEFIHTCKSSGAESIEMAAVTCAYFFPKETMCVHFLCSYLLGNTERSTMSIFRFLFLLQKRKMFFSSYVSSTLI